MLFDDYFPCRKDNNDCKLKHVMNWLSLFVDMHNREIMEKIVKWTEPKYKIEWKNNFLPFFFFFSL